jgi:hypothetical protein
LLVAVEEFFRYFPNHYIDVLHAYRFGVICEDACVAHLLYGMSMRSRAAAAFLRRRLAVTEMTQDLGVLGVSEDVLEERDTLVAPESHHGDTCALRRELRIRGIPAWSQIENS